MIYYAANIGYDAMSSSESRNFKAFGQSENSLHKRREFFIFNPTPRTHTQTLAVSSIQGK